jgi:hypothetical protein
LHWSIQYSVHNLRAHNITEKNVNKLSKTGQLGQQFIIFIIVGRWREGGVIPIPAMLSLICTLSSSLIVFRNGNI